ncbi:MAG: two-component sensor histidine kinase [Lysobacteraceae bacterium]|nr:MAG: two-component sensor histidine kinase [Xanthomonadaceae bacterium]
MASATDLSTPPRFKRKLRSRIIITFVLFSILLSGLFAVTALWMRSYLENDLIGETLKRDLDQHLSSLEQNPGTANAEPFSSRVYAYVTRAGNPDIQLPSEFRSLPSGVHDVTNDGRQFKVAVNKTGMFWGYVIYDVSPNPREKTQLLTFLGGASVVFLLLAWLLAVWSSKHVMAPVSHLARRIATMGEANDQQLLAPDFPGDEVGQLAAALDDYAQRLTEIVIRDKEFNADVSHELRTPLAVIRSAAELLLAQPDLNDKTRARLQRIERAVRQSTELTTALLHLVRGERDHPESEHSTIGELVDNVVDSMRPQLGNKSVDVRVDIEQDYKVDAPDAVIAVALGNLIGNAFKYTPAGEVVITVSASQVRVADSGPGIESSELGKVFARHYRGSSASGKGAGLGLAIVQRLCDLYGWHVDVASGTPGGLVATLVFEPEPETDKDKDLS